MIPEGTYKATPSSPRENTAANSPIAGVDGDQPEEAHYRRYTH
jgi:hypothetical protein